MVVIAMSCLQETPARWVAIHRRHHQFADEQPDPHSPLASFFWAHIGWILVRQPELTRLGIDPKIFANINTSDDWTKFR